VIASGQKTSPLVSDPALIAACLNGDLPSWDALIDRYQGFIYTLTLRMGVSAPDADDIFQNVCVSLFQHLGDLRDTSRLSGWLATAIRQEVWRLARRPRALPLSSLVEEGETEERRRGAAPTLTPEEEVLKLEREHLVRQGLQHLSEPCKELLSLLYSEDPPCSYAEMAARLQIPLGSIGPKRARCLEQLRKILANFGY